MFFVFVLTMMAALNALALIAIIYGLKKCMLQDKSGSQVGATALLMFFLLNTVCLVLCAMAMRAQG